MEIIDQDNLDQEAKQREVDGLFIKRLTDLNNSLAHLEEMGFATSAAATLHNVDLEQVRRAYGEQAHFTAMLLEDNFHTFVTAKIDGLGDITLFGKSR